MSEDMFLLLIGAMYGLPLLGMGIILIVCLFQWQKDIDRRWKELNSNKKEEHL